MEPELSTPRIEDLLRHREWLARLARKLVREPGAAEDLAQETWLATLRTNRPLVEPRGFLRTVARRAAWRRGRRTSRGLEVSLSELSEEPAANQAAIERVHLQAAVARAVTQLDEPYRSAIVERFFEERPPREIARRSGVPVETVKSRIKRGLALLRGMLRGEFVDRGGLRALLPLAVCAAKRKGTTLTVPLPLVGVITVNLKLFVPLVLTTIPLLSVFVFADVRETSAPSSPGTPSDREVMAAERGEEVGLAEGGTTTRDDASSHSGIVGELLPGTLYVQVHARGGGPLGGIPVAILVERNGNPRILAQQTTGTGTGLATFQGYPETLELQPEDAPTVLVLGHLRELPREALPRDRAPEEPVRLELGPHARVTVRLLDGEDVPVDQGGGVYLFAPREDWPAQREATPLFCKPNVRVPMEAGIAHFPVVEPNTAIEVTSHVSGLELGFSSALPPVRITSPTTSEHREILVRVPQPILTGRVLDVDGTPLRNGSLRAWTQEHRALSTFGQSLELVTDAEGRFRLVTLPKPAEEASARALLISRGVQATNRNTRVPAGPRASVSFPLHLSEGRHDLGDLRLAEDPFLLGGRVVDSEGVSVVGAAVYAVTPEFDARLVALPGAPLGPVLEGLTDERGTFELRGVWSRERVKLVVRRPGNPLVEALFTPGTPDAHVVLGVTTSVRGRVLLDPEMAGQALLVQLRDAEGRGGDTRLAPDGTFAVEGLRPGRYSFALSEPARLQQGVGLEALRVEEGVARALHLLRIEDLVLEPGENAPTPLDPVDVRGRFLRASLTLVGSNGEPIASETVHIHASERVIGTTDEAGRLAWIADRSSGPLWIAVKDHALARLEAPASEARVRLARATVVHLEPQGTLEIPERPRYLAVQLEPLDVPANVHADWLVGSHMLRRPVYEQQLRPFTVPWPGRYRVLWDTGVHMVQMKPDAFAQGELLAIEAGPNPATFPVAPPEFE